MFKLLNNIKNSSYFYITINVLIWAVIFGAIFYVWKYPDTVKVLFPDTQLPHIHLINIFQAVIFFLIVLYISRFIRRVVRHRIHTQDKKNISFYYSLLKIITYTGWLIAIWGALAFLGLNTQNLAIILGALSVGIGFGLQHIVNNFVSGLLILFERPISIGDWIKVGDQEGIVKNILIRATELENFDKSSVLIPNATILSSNLINLTHQNTDCCFTLNVGVSYDSDMDKVKEILLKTTEKTTGVSRTRTPKVFMKDFADSAVIFEIRIFVDDVADKSVVRSDVMFAIWDVLKAANIEMPFPQSVVHIAK